MTQKTNFNHQTIGYGYNPLNDKLVSETYVGGSISYNYDGFLRRQSMMDTSGNTTYNYDARDRLLAKNSPFGSITYGYDHHGNLTSVASSNPNGTNVGYEYDSLNRPVTVTDSHWGVNTTTYSYDNIGNLNKEVLLNGASVTYVYDVLNRLNSMTAKVNGSQVAGYAYTLGPAGNKTQVIENHPISGASRMVNYGYDDLYRLTNETVSNDPTYNGVVSYIYDPVGNRNARNSSLSPITTQNFSGEYDANDRLGGTYSYDSDGNTLNDGTNTYTYDGLDRLTQVTGPSTNVQYVYDGDGNRVQVIDNTHGTTTNLLVDTNNLTGYAQVLESLQGSGVNKVYTYGTNRISEDQFNGSSWSLSFYGYDGQGSVRYLTDTNGNVTDTYDYDAFGNLVNKTGTTKNEFLYDGEHQDASTGFYYLRARYMNPTIGRFNTADSFEGLNDDPQTLHKYLFCANNPINLDDPEGHEYDIGSVGMSLAIVGVVSSFPKVAFASNTAETNYILLIQDFNYASADTGIPVNVLGSLAWDESGWNRNAQGNPRAHGIMQLYDSQGHPGEYANLSDSENIEIGAQILESDFKKHISHHLYGQNITPAQLADPWFIPVVLYKDSFRLAYRWEDQIYSSWPAPKAPRNTPTLLQTLWKQYAN